MCLSESTPISPICICQNYVRNCCCCHVACMAIGQPDLCQNPVGCLGEGGQVFILTGAKLQVASRPMIFLIFPI